MPAQDSVLGTGIFTAFRLFDDLLPIKNAGDGDGAAVEISFVYGARDGQVATERRAHNGNAVAVDHACGQHGFHPVRHIVMHFPESPLVFVGKAPCIAGGSAVVGLEHGIATARKELYLRVEPPRVACPWAAVGQHDKRCGMFLGRTSWQGDIASSTE